LKHAIVFSVENQIDPTSPHSDGSSAYEKMAIGLAYSIRATMPNVDVYCGNFTSNKLSNLAKEHFAKLNITVIEDLIFPAVSTAKFDGTPDNLQNDYYTFNGFLRSYTKKYFANKLLDEYDYLVYTDCDVLFLKPIEFDFDPTGPYVLVEPAADWIKNFLNANTVRPSNITGNLYLNWIEVINSHNSYLYDLDYASDDVCYEHASDVLVSRNIDSSSLTIIDQDIGAYHFFKPITEKVFAIHYDSLGVGGSLHFLNNQYPALYKKYVMLFEKGLNVPVTNEIGYWEATAERYK